MLEAISYITGIGQNRPFGYVNAGRLPGTPGARYRITPTDKMTLRTTASEFAVYGWDLVSGTYGLIGDVSTAVFILSYYVAGLESWRPLLGVVLVIGFVVSGFKLLCASRQHTRDAERRIEELERIIAALQQPKYSAPILSQATEQYGALGHVLREAVRHLLVVGEMTDALMQAHLSKKGLAHGASSILEGLSNQTTLVQRVVPERQSGEHVSGYKGPYKINPVFREALDDVVATDGPSPG